MAAAGKGKSEGLLGITQSDARILLLGILSADNAGKIDFKKLSVIAPYKNPATAYSAYRQARKRFYAANGTVDPSSSGAQATPPKKAPAKKKGAAAAVDSDSANEDGDTLVEGAEPVSPTPTPKPKRQRKTAPKPQVVIQNEAETDHDSDNSSLKPEQKQLEADLTNAIKSEGQYTPRLHRWKTDEEQIMTDINLDAEFEEMERNKQLSESRRSSARLAPLSE
ncbi:hypothetical protein BDW60DRAFT_209084 [Aspergillus nidulans var. acristatus]